MASYPLLYYPDGPAFWLGSSEVVMARKSANILILLLECKDRYISTEEIHEIVWPTTIVTRDLVKDYIAKVRKALYRPIPGGPSIDSRRHQGYRFVGDVQYCDAVGQVSVESDNNIFLGNNDIDVHKVMEASNRLRIAPTIEKHKQSLKLLSSAREAAPDNTELLVESSLLHHLSLLHGFKRSREDNSKEMMLRFSSSAYGLQPKCPKTAARFGSSLAAIREFDIANSILTRAMETPDRPRRLLHVYASFLAQLGKHEQSNRALRKNMQGNNNICPSSYWMLACNLFQLGNYEEALLWIKKYISLHPNTIRPRFAYTVILAMSGRQEKAEKVLSMLTKSFPGLNLNQEYQHHSTYYRNPADIERLIAGMRKAGLK